MRRHVRLILAALAAGTVLAAATAASANTLLATEQAFSIVWGAMSFTAPEVEANVTCPVTLGGSFTSGTFAKTARAAIGRVTSVSVGGCAGGTVRALVETLPWTIQYELFTGTLPAIRSVVDRLIGASFSVDPSGIVPACLARTTEGSPVRVELAREEIGEITSVRSDERAGIPLTGGFGCTAVTGRLSGTGSVTVARETAGVALYLDEIGIPLTERGAAGPNQIGPLIIPAAPVKKNTAVLTNESPKLKQTQIAAAPIGVNAGEFQVLAGNPEDCTKAGFELRPARDNICTVRVEFIGGGVRPVASRIQVEYKLGNAVRRLKQSFLVIAE